MGEFCMPSLGAAMEEGRLLEWLVKPGDQVSRGDVVAVVETDKAALEVEIWESGTIQELLIEEGTKVPVGTAIATVGEGAPAPAERAAEEPATEAPAEEPAAEEPAPEEPTEEREPAVPAPEVAEEPAPASVPAPAPSPEPARVPATVGAAPTVRGPLARHRAEELHLDLARIVGTGPGGAITRHDVETAGTRPRVSPYARRLAAERSLDLLGVSGTGPDGAIVARDLPDGGAAAPSPPPTEPPAPEPATAAPAARKAEESGDRNATMRAAIARAMTKSKQEIPHYYLGTHVDVTALMDWLRDHNAAVPIRERLLPAAPILRAVALAARDVPEMNGFWVDGAFQPSDAVHLGMAVSLKGGGLVAPAIMDAHTLTPAEIMQALHGLVKRARSGRLTARESTSATLTVTSLGDLGVETVYGVITPPQVAILGLGKVQARPWATEDGLLGVRQVVHLTLSADHRASDGMIGARFLTRITDLLATPEEL